MGKAVLHLELVCDLEHVAECAAALQGRLAQDQWSVLSALAGEILARAETAPGQKALVVLASPEEVDRVAKAAGLPAVG